MRRLIVFIIIFSTGILVSAQDFSNKGKEFWLAYSYHVGMVNSGGLPQMTLYITSDVTTTFNVEVFGGSLIQSGSITAGQVVTVIVPTTNFINNEGLFSGKAIRVTGEKPIVVYAYITRSAASGATLCLPTTVLGKEYYSMNFTQVSNEANSNSYFTIVAVEDNTSVEITPSALTKNGWAANSVHTVTLNKGQIYQVLGSVSGNNGVDLTGSKIKSIATGTGGCKRIAVFSGSGKIRIAAGTSCASTINSSDNLYQQLYPIASWGKKYLTAPSFSRPTNIYRIIKSDPGATVTVNGAVIPAASFTNNLYYQFFNATANLIESDQPISVSQYFTTQGCDGNASPYDPDMIMLNPVEQNIDKVTLVSSNLIANNPQHHIHVIMRNTGTGISSFRVDGNPVAASSWITHPRDGSYSYLYLSNVSQGYHRLVSDSGFNATAYGYADAETYGYSGGANVKDLYQFVSIQNQYATVSFPAACKGSPFFFSMTFPYQPTSIEWQFNGLFPNVTISNPVSDSSWLVNGKQLYRYKLPTPYTITTIGTYPIKVVAQNPTADGCSGEQEINYDLQVFERPTANFSFTSNGCVSDSVRFLDASDPNTRPIIKYVWNFGDATTASTANPAHLYSTPGSFATTFTVITDVGCISDTISKTITLAVPPVAKFGVSSPVCAGKPLSFSDSSASVSGNLVKWYWNFGDGSAETVNSANTSQAHSFAAPGAYTVTLKVETATGCQSQVFQKLVTVGANPQPEFSFGNACLPSASVTFTNNSTSSEGANSLTYNWSFGDGLSSAAGSPTHVYSSTGPFNVKLVATSGAGCKDSISKAVNTVYAQPAANFTSPAAVCLGSTLNFADASAAPGSSVTQWSWDFGDGNSSTSQSPSHTYTAAGSYTVTLTVNSAIGCVSSTFSKQVIIHSLPQSNFNVSSPTCANRSITFSDASLSVSGSLVKWTWNFGDASAAVVNSSNANVVHTYNSTGSFTATLVTESSVGCVSSVRSRLIVSNAVPVPGFAMPGNCLADPFTQFTDTSKIADGTAGQFTYVWNFGDANSSSQNPNTSTAKNPVHKFSTAGNYQVAQTVVSSAGCSATVTQTFTLNGSVPQSIFNLTSTQNCSNQSLSLVNNSTVDVGSLVKLEIFWDYANDPTIKSVITNPVVGAMYAHSYPEFFSPSQRTALVRVVAYSGDNCLHTSSASVTLLASPQIVFTAFQGVCGDAIPFQLSQASVTNGIAGAGVYSGNGVVNNVFNPSTAGAGNHVIRYTFTGANGCTSFKEQTISVYRVPTADAGPNRFVLEGGTATLAGQGMGPGLSYAWSPSTYLSSVTSPQPVVTPASDIRYTLVVTTADGCKATDTVSVKVLKMPVIPNVFSPNGDGVNDRWVIRYLESYPGAVVQIFNAYGQMVFESTGYAKAWDGTFHSKPLPAATYYYIINPKNGRQQISGFVDIVR